MDAGSKRQPHGASSEFVLRTELDPIFARDLALLVLAGSVPTVAFLLLGPRHLLARLSASLTCVVFALRYLWWRWFISMPEDQLPWQQVWAWVFLLFETASTISFLFVYIAMTRFRDRSPDVDARKNSKLLSAPVDVFIATYNEEKQILERTIVGAVSIEHPDLRVWVLDDGARAWVRELAEEIGARYISRTKRVHAKAGNINHALGIALSEGRKPQFILLLDADFVASRNILKRTLPLFEEEDVGIVQTPQHFFNPDPIQANLLISSVWPDEQRFFFNYLMPCKDAWGSAFLCGTSAVLRVDALVKCGGIPTATVTEDVLTTFSMIEAGYRTIYLNEKLSNGLAPEGLREYVSQRCRWCLGAIQQVYTKWGFLGRARIRFVNRVSAFETFLYWSSNFPFKLMVVSAPLIYWFTGTSVIFSSVSELIFWLGPYVVAGTAFMATLGGKTVLPIITDVSQLIVAPALTKTVAIGLVKPWGHPFRVTAKGLRTEGITIQWRLLAPFAVLALLTALGMIINMYPGRPLYGTPGYSLNVFWSIFDIALLSMACAICVELPKRREEERFISGEKAAVIFLGTNQIRQCLVMDIGVSGARLFREDGWDKVQENGVLLLDQGAVVLPFSSVRSQGNELAIKFELDDKERRFLIKRIFTGDYGNEVEKVSLSRVLLNTLRKVFS
jgi:cellulose synthase (UDP-forming)